MKFNLANESDIADLQLALKTCPKVIIDFLEEFCGYNTAILSHDPNEISYCGGKRDVILTIKTIMRDELLPKQIAETFKGKL